MDQAERIVGGRPQNPDQSLEELVRQARAGDEEAFRLLVRSVFPRIYRWALARTRDADEADDVTQAVLVRLYRHLDSFSGKGSFDTWLYRITANAAATSTSARSRRDRRLRLLTDQEDASLAQPHSGRTSSRDQTSAAVSRIHRTRVMDLVLAYFRALPARQREVFDLVDLQGNSPAEVATMLDLNPATVRASLFKARRTVRRKILERHPELA